MRNFPNPQALQHSPPHRHNTSGTTGHTDPFPSQVGEWHQIRSPSLSEQRHRGFVLESLKPIKPLASIKGPVLSFFNPPKGLEEFCQDKLLKGTTQPRSHQASPGLGPAPGRQSRPCGTGPRHQPHLLMLQPTITTTTNSSGGPHGTVFWANKTPGIKVLSWGPGVRLVPELQGLGQGSNGQQPTCHASKPSRVITQPTNRYASACSD